MYEVVESLKDVESVVVYDEKGNEIEDYLFSNPLFCPIGKLEEIEPLTAESEFSDYNNIVVSWETGELIIFQDYGDEQAGVPLGYCWVDRRAIFPGENPSLGYYKGWFVWVDVIFNKLRVRKLFKAGLPDLDDLNWKRPYSFYLLEKEKELYYYVYLKLNNSDGAEYLVESPLSYDEVFSTENFNKIISWQYNSLIDTSNCLTRDYLVVCGFSYDYDKDTWKRGDLEIKDNGVFYAVSRKFYYKGKNIVLKTELDRLIEKQ